MKKTIIITSAITLIAGGLIGFLVVRNGSGNTLQETLSQTEGNETKQPQNQYSQASPQTEQSPQKEEQGSAYQPIKNRMHIITIETSKGVIKFETYDADAPKTVQNFVTLAQKGFYNGLTFHRVIGGFMIQGGDPNGNGTGGPGYKFEDELNSETESYNEGYKKGVVAMANAGPNTNGSQFFIMLEDNPLPHTYTIFGKVVEGQEVVDAIGKVAVGVNDKPLEAIVMKKVNVSDNSH
ncbi:MAG: peptidyl-prolyl cis-trans isomerase-like 1 [Parcubacteria group bacterium Gr01-1014_33]|nr:MAG: peptidyl-prolyl cis-trans isomerase-like 1 [Parcubacteria group bacterium Gr01-1014_33]